MDAIGKMKNQIFESKQFVIMKLRIVIFFLNKQSRVFVFFFIIGCMIFRISDFVAGGTDQSLQLVTIS